MGKKKTTASIKETYRTGGERKTSVVSIKPVARIRMKPDEIGKMIGGLLGATNMESATVAKWVRRPEQRAVSPRYSDIATKSGRAKKSTRSSSLAGAPRRGSKRGKSTTGYSVVQEYQWGRVVPTSEGLSFPSAKRAIEFGSVNAQTKKVFRLGKRPKP